MAKKDSLLFPQDRTMTSTAVSTADFVLYIYHRWRDWLAVLDIRDRRFATTAERLHTRPDAPTLSLSLSLSHSHTPHRHTDAHTLMHTHTHIYKHTNTHWRIRIRWWGGDQKETRLGFLFFLFCFCLFQPKIVSAFFFRIVPRRVVTHTLTHTIRKLAPVSFSVPTGDDATALNKTLTRANWPTTSR